MNEEKPPNLIPEKSREKPNEKGMGLLALWQRDHPEEEVKGKRESGPEVIKFKEMIDSFESEHSLAELHQIINLTPKEAPDYPLRESAKKALIPIVKLLNTLRDETDISLEEWKELKGQYRRLSQAVGIINNNKVHHDR